jgi:hypothetical protein
MMTPWTIKRRIQISASYHESCKYYPRPQYVYKAKPKAIDRPFGKEYSGWPLLAAMVLRVVMFKRCTVKENALHRRFLANAIVDKYGPDAFKNLTTGIGVAKEIKNIYANLKK